MREAHKLASAVQTLLRIHLGLPLAIIVGSRLAEVYKDRASPRNSEYCIPTSCSPIAMMATTTNRTPKSDDSPSHTAEHRDEEAWSGDDGSDVDVDVDDGSGKRKRQRRTSRPLSVSCELCKSRKVCFLLLVAEKCGFRLIELSSPRG